MGKWGVAQILYVMRRSMDAKDEFGLRTADFENGLAGGLENIWAGQGGDGCDDRRGLAGRAHLGRHSAQRRIANFRRKST